MKDAAIIPLFDRKETEGPVSLQSITDLQQEELELNAVAHQHHYFELGWIIKGSGELQVDLCTYPIGDNVFFCLKPGQVHRLRIDTGGEGYLFSFANSFFDPGELESECAFQAVLGRLFSDPQGIGISREIAGDMLTIVEKMREELAHRYPYRTLMLKRYFRILLIYLTRLLAGDEKTALQTKEQLLLFRFMERLDRDFREKRMVADYAQQLSVTPNYLNRIVKKHTGYCAGHFIRQRVVLEAKRLGLYSCASMKEIAYDLGFPDCSHFSKFFKTVAGTNFSEFKKGA